MSAPCLPARGALGALVAALVLLGLAPAAAQEGEPGGDSDASVRLELVRIDAAVRADGVLRLRADVTNGSRQDREGLRLVATVHRRTTSRYEFQQALDGGVVGTVVHGFAADVGTVPGRGARTVELRQHAEDLGLSRMEGLEGVYPLRLQLLDADDVVDELVTSFVATTEEVARPLRVALIMTAARPPRRDAGGVLAGDALVGDLSHGGVLGEVTGALAAQPDVPVTVAVDAYTLAEVAELARGAPAPGQQRGTDPPAAAAGRAVEALAALRAAAGDGRAELLALPYASADLVALVRGGLAQEASRHLTDGARGVEAATGVRPREEILVPPDGITPEALAQAFAAGARAVVLTAEYLRLPDITGPTPSSVRRLRAGPGTVLPALVPDPWLQATLDAAAPARPAAAAQRVIGELATIYHERPGVDARGILIAVPPGAQPPGLAAALLAAVGSVPFAEPVTLSELRQQVTPEPLAVGLAYPEEARARELSADYVAGLRQARRALGSLDGVVVDDRATPARFDRLLLQAASVHYRSPDASAGRALLDTVTSTVEELYATVEVPETPAVTLTSLEGELPVTVRSTADVALRVRVHLRTARLEVEGGPTREIVLEPGATALLRLPVRALSPGGTAPVDVLVTDADGEVVLATGQVVVRSTAFSVTAVLVVSGAALFLLVWLLREYTRRRGRARPGPSTRPVVVEPAPSRTGVPHASARDRA